MSGQSFLNAPTNRWSIQRVNDLRYHLFRALNCTLLIPRLRSVLPSALLLPISACFYWSCWLSAWSFPVNQWSPLSPSLNKDLAFLWSPSSTCANPTFYVWYYTSYTQTTVNFIWHCGIPWQKRSYKCNNKSGRHYGYGRTEGVCISLSY